MPDAADVEVKEADGNPDILNVTTLIVDQATGLAITAGASPSVTLGNRDASPTQIGVVNIGGDVTGAQIGVVNYARRLRGTQVGVVDIASEGDGAAPIGLVTFVKNGIHEVELTTNEAFSPVFSGVLGTRHFYTRLGIGMLATPSSIPGGRTVTPGSPDDRGEDGQLRGLAHDVLVDEALGRDRSHGTGAGPPVPGRPLSWTVNATVETTAPD